MTWTEILIIYLACGSPFAVYQITQSAGPFSPSQLSRLGVAFLGWPVLAFMAARRRFFSGKDDLDRPLELKVGQARTAIEEIAFPERSAGSLLGFREVYDRYTGLALAACQNAGPATELFEISGHSKPDIATQVLARRNREKLLFHRTQARNEFVDLIAELSVESDEVVRLACDLATALGDTDGVADLQALVSRPEDQRQTRDRSAVASVR